MRLTGLGRRLVQDGLVDEETARQAQEASKKQGVSLVNQLVEKAKLEPRQIVMAAASEFGIPVLDISAFDAESIPKDLLNEQLVRRRQALPLIRRSNRLFVAIADPTNLVALDEIKFNTGIPTEPVLVEIDKLGKLIEDSLSAAADVALAGELDEDLDRIEVTEAEEAEAPTPVTGAEAEDTPVVRFVNRVLLDAINKGASDIHFEPYERKYRVRYRMDGILYEMVSPPRNLAPRITARLKVMSRMDISERRVPQDGRIKLQLSKRRAIDFRVNTLPTLFGEKVVLRILDPSIARMGIDQLGFEEDQRQLYVKALSAAYGMILVTGPTGSGKTVTLYTGLNILNEPGRNISTAEDPAEINVPGVNQVNVHPRIGLTFASALRAFLRQDPDVIVVGEVRDLETAEIAIKAAQTGHLVLSTLHTNDAPQTLTRLMNMGVPTYNIASSVTLIIAQRLARRLCSRCKTPDDIPREELLREGFREDEVEQVKVYKPVGCDQCTNGYKGRVGIYQVMEVSDEMGRIIMAGGNASDLEAQATKEGVANLREAGLQKIRNGVTSLEEVNRVTVD